MMMMVMIFKEAFGVLSPNLFNTVSCFCPLSPLYWLPSLEIFVSSFFSKSEVSMLSISWQSSTDCS